jgi:hypothetical protein
VLLQLIFVVQFLGGVAQQQPAEFWVSERADPRLWRDVRAVFRQELQPDDPAKMAEHVAAMRYKYLARIGRVSDVALVVTRERLEETILPDLDLFVVFSYDLLSHKKVRLGAFSMWNVVKWTYLAPNIPEIVFTHWNCTECENDILLSSFFLDAASRTWTMRKWPKDGESILVFSNAVAGDDPNSGTDCLYRVADFSGDGYADFAVWCRETFDDPSRKMQESVTLYSVSQGRATKRTVDAIHAQSLKRSLCQSRESHSFCAGNHE